MGEIHLSKNHEVNPSLEVCARCGKETNCIVLLGATNKYRCPLCKRPFYGSRKEYLKKGCPSCGGDASHGPELVTHGAEAPRHIATGHLCDPCKKEVAEFNQEVKAGGIRWRCTDCQKSGVIKGESPFAKSTRRDNPEYDWDKTGLTFSKVDCPVCVSNPVKECE